METMFTSLHKTKLSSSNRIRRQADKRYNDFAAAIRTQSMKNPSQSFSGVFHKPQSRSSPQFSCLSKFNGSLPRLFTVVFTEDREGSKVNCSSREPLIKQLCYLCVLLWRIPEVLRSYSAPTEEDTEEHRGHVRWAL